MQYVKSHLVENMEVDLIDYNGKNIFQTLLIYINDQTAALLVKRLNTIDETSGWTDEINVFIHDHHGNNQTIYLGHSEKSNIKFIENVSFSDKNIRFLRSTKKVEQELLPGYENEINTNRLNLIGDIDFFNEFNKAFRLLLSNKMPPSP